MLITEVVGIRASVEGGGKSGFFCGEGRAKICHGQDFHR